MQGFPTPTPASIGAQPADALLSALVALAGNGILEKTGSGTAAAASIGATGRDLLAAANDAAARGAIGAQEVFTFGTWTPSYILTTSGSVTTNLAGGFSLLIPPDFVWMAFTLRSASVTSPVGNVRLSLPFVVSSSSFPLSVGDAAAWGAGVSSTIQAVALAGTNQIQLTKNTANQGSSLIAAADLSTANNGNLIRVSGIYQRGL